MTLHLYQTIKTRHCYRHHERYQKRVYIRRIQTWELDIHNFGKMTQKENWVLSWGLAGTRKLPRAIVQRYSRLTKIHKHSHCVVTCAYIQGGLWPMYRPQSYLSWHKSSRLIAWCIRSLVWWSTYSVLQSPHNNYMSFWFQSTHTLRSCSQSYIIGELHFWIHTHAYSAWTMQRNCEWDSSSQYVFEVPHIGQPSIYQVTVHLQLLSFLGTSKIHTLKQFHVIYMATVCIYVPAPSLGRIRSSTAHELHHTVCHWTPNSSECTHIHPLR